jgi:diguanylate cyclase (GGDEF)-like protein
MQTISTVRDNSGAVQHYVGMFTDITDIKEQQQRLEHIAHYDALTNLPNRVLLADRLRQAMAHCLRRGQTLAVAYLDLDGFKEVNDSHGHGVGDRMLIAVSQHIKEALREGDTLARIGGDEFVAVMVDLDDATHCEPVLMRLLRAAARPVTVDDKVLQVAASIGVTLYPKDNADPDLLLRHADQAMYFAKDAGKNQYHFFDVESAANVQSERESLQAVGLALERHEFVLHYQPKVNMRTGEVVGAEALIRWQHPQRGLLSPAAFLSTVENHTLAISIGEWVIATALAQMASWQKQGLELPVSVNIGASQLEQQGFPKRLAQLLANQPGIPAHCLQLEVLESSALDDTTLVSVSMQACMALGVTFALDDFGTGYSSLAYLRRLPAETLKIDQSFVRDMLSDPNDLAIVQGVISLAQAFRRSVIAEGVETRLHGDKLLELGCELAQGYGIARPMPADEVPDWAKRWQAQPNWKG